MSKTARRPQNRKRPPASAPSDAPRWFEITNLADGNGAEIFLRGYIGEPKEYYSHYDDRMIENPNGAGTLKEFESELTALGDVANLTLSIFSEGGDVFTGMAVANLLQRHPARKVCNIDGICASAATYPALACDEIRIPANAWMMIHGSEGCCCGSAEEMHGYADMLDQVNATIVNLYTARTGKTAEEISAMLEAETWMDGRTAVENGFADTVVEPLQNMAARAGTLQPTNAAMLRAAPAEVLALFDMTRLPKTPFNSMKIRTPLMTAAADPAAPAGGTAGGSPASAPAPAPAAAAPPAPTNAAPPAPAPAASAAPAAAPTNAAPAFTLADIQTVVTNAIAPLQQRLEVVEGQRKHGIAPENLAGASAATGIVPGETKSMPRNQFEKLPHVERNRFMREGGRLTES